MLTLSLEKAVKAAPVPECLAEQTSKRLRALPAGCSPLILSTIPVPAPVTNWTGFYLGGTIGGAYQTATTTDVDYYDYGGSYSQSDVSFVYGLHAGYNWQYGMGVFGIEADISGNTFSKSVSNFPDDNGTRTIKASSDWFSTVRGRLGLASGNALVYVTGGVAFVDRKQVYNFIAIPDPSASANGVATGFAAGAGVEVALNNHWSVRAEYLFIGVPEETKILYDPQAQITNNRFNMSYEAQIARVGVSYKFGGCCDYVPLK
jgi:outer membrane immunogenic protein